MSFVSLCGPDSARLVQLHTIQTTQINTHHWRHLHAYNEVTNIHQWEVLKRLNNCSYQIMYCTNLTTFLTQSHNLFGNTSIFGTYISNINNIIRSHKCISGSNSRSSKNTMHWLNIFPIHCALEGWARQMQQLRALVPVRAKQMTVPPVPFGVVVSCHCYLWWA